jgi:uncharacterized protein YjbJ (UPF0337 family)
MSNRDIAAGKAKQVEGALLDAKGDLTGKASDHIAGKAKKAEGKVQEGMGRLEKGTRRLSRDLKNAAK